MCFSARASFLAAGLLLGIGGLSLSKVTKRKQLPFALLPLFFALQQCAEGMLWVLIPRGGPPSLITLATTIFLTFAFIVYPLWLPLSVWVIEKSPLRRSLITLCGLVGALWSTTAAYQILRHGAVPTIKGCHIYYALEQAFLPLDYSIVLYAIATILPFFIARSLPLKLFGLALGLSCAVSYYVWYTHFVSVWCFFVALLSLGVYVLIGFQNKKT